AIHLSAVVLGTLPSRHEFGPGLDLLRSEVQFRRKCTGIHTATGPLDAPRYYLHHSTPRQSKTHKTALQIILVTPEVFEH
ncbi:MAG TPA: hypothetical protein VFV47_02670, partial [Hyphomicrobiaceae bacterium]|nr:hypothetical protein [Hyphomicrobiaceae bacterium]